MSDELEMWIPVEIIAVTRASLEPQTRIIFAGENCRFIAHSGGDNEEKHVYLAVEDTIKLSASHKTEHVQNKLFSIFSF